MSSGAVRITPGRHARRPRRDTRCSANRSTARETAAPGTGCSRRRSVTCAGLGPARAVSRLSPATRRSHGSLPQHVSHRSADAMDHSPQGASERGDCERRDALQRVKRARSVMAAQLTELRGYARTMWRARFSTASNPGSPPRLRGGVGIGAPGQNAPSGDGRWRLKRICGIKLTKYAALMSLIAPETSGCALPFACEA